MSYFDSASSMEKVFDDQSNDEDFLLALRLQSQFAQEEQENEDENLNKITQVT